jgi:curved DNA-binding protein CbpA
MLQKNYYTILDIPVHASLLEIKTAYRKLVRIYHPDMQAQSQASSQIFLDIQLAYETLSHPAKRSVYDAQLKKSGQFNPFVITAKHSAAEVLQQSIDLRQYLSKIDARRLNQDALADFILALLCPENMEALLRVSDAQRNEEIIAHVLFACKTIHAKRTFSLIASCLCQLTSNQLIQQQIQQALALREQQEQQNKLVPYAALAIVLLIILVMYFILG